MTEVPQLPIEEIHQRVVGWWIGNYYGSVGYLGKKLGRRGVREFVELGARQVAATFKHMDLKTPGEVALAVATNEKNMFGSEVSVIENGEDVELQRHRCALLAGAKAFSRLGASLLAIEHCKNCTDGHWKRVFDEMGFGFSCEHTDEGCTMRLSPKKRA
jgi:hypothetical protein